MRRIAILGSLLLSLLVLPAVAAAQDATPDPTLDVPAPEECTVAPRTVGELQTLFAAPASPIPAPASPTPVALPTGTPVDPATAEAVTAAIRQLIACLNAGDYWRLLATYSDRYVQIFLQAYIDPATGLTQETFDAYATPNPPQPERHTALLEIGDILFLPDGRVAAVVIADDLGDDLAPAQTIFYLVKNGDRWQIDDFAYIPRES